MLIIDKYAYTNRLSKVNPNKKVAIGVIFLIASMVIQNIFILSGIMILMSILVVCVAGIDLKNYLKLLRIPMYFLFLSIGITLVNISFNKADLLYSFEFFSFNVGISKASIDMSIHVLFRAMSCLTCVYFCILTTPFNQLIFFFKNFIYLTLLSSYQC
ncbi:CbiQ family ECF transporter T component [Clostridioides difficile]